MIKIGIAGFGKIGQLRAKILSEYDDVQILEYLDLTVMNINITLPLKNY